LDEVLTVKELLDRLRKPEEKHSNPFVELLPKAQKLLGLNKLDTISLEALLIQAIIYCVFHNENEPDEISKKDAKKRDSYLLTMGLLDEYYHVKGDGTHYSVNLRYTDYLGESEYIELSYEKDFFHKNLTAEVAYARAKAVLSSTDKRCRENLADYLSKSENCQKCFEKGTKNFIKVDLFNGETRRQLIKPKARYTRKNFPFSTDQEDKPKSFGLSVKDTLSGCSDSIRKIAEFSKIEKLAKEELYRLNRNDGESPLEIPKDPKGNTVIITQNRKAENIMEDNRRPRSSIFPTVEKAKKVSTPGLSTLLDDDILTAIDPQYFGRAFFLEDDGIYTVRLGLFHGREYGALEEESVIFCAIPTKANYIQQITAAFDITEKSVRFLDVIFLESTCPFTIKPVPDSLMVARHNTMCEIPIKYDSIREDDRIIFVRNGLRRKVPNQFRVFFDVLSIQVEIVFEK